jgi:hypothetical protein
VKVDANVTFPAGISAKQANATTTAMLSQVDSLFSGGANSNFKSKYSVTGSVLGAEVQTFSNSE